MTKRAHNSCNVSFQDSSLELGDIQYTVVNSLNEEYNEVPRFDCSDEDSPGSAPSPTFKLYSGLYLAASR